MIFKWSKRHFVRVRTTALEKQTLDRRNKNFIHSQAELNKINKKIMIIIIIAVTTNSADVK